MTKATLEKSRKGNDCFEDGNCSKPTYDVSKVFEWKQYTSRTSRWRIIRVLAEMKSAIKKPPLTMNHKEKRVEFAVKYMKQDSDKVTFTDECRATLDSPDGFSRGWVLNKLDIPVRLRRQQGGSGVIFWAAIFGSRYSLQGTGQRENDRFHVHRDSGTKFDSRKTIF